MARRTLALLAAMLATLAAPAEAAWSQAISPHFVIYLEELPARLRAYAQKLERFDAALRQIQKIDDPPLGLSNRLTVFVVSDIGKVQSLMRAGPGRSSVAGFYSPRANGSFAVVPRDAGPDQSGNLSREQILLHEYAHHFMFRNYASAFPAWFSEGFAEFYGTARFDADGGVGLGLPAQHRAMALFFANGLSLKTMVGATYGRLSDEQAQLLYGRGWLLTHYLTLNPKRAGQLDRYLAAINAGSSAATAAEAFGDLKLLDRELDQYMNARKLKFIKLPSDTISIGAIEVRPLSPGASAIMALRIRSHAGVNARTAPGVARDMRRLAAPYRGDPFVERALAEAEYDAGDLDAADAAADAALRADPKLVDAFIYKGRVALDRAIKAGATDAATWRGARQWFTRANAIENDNPAPLMWFYLGFTKAGAKPPVNAIAALQRAHDLAPEDDDLRLMVVRQYLLDGAAAPATKMLGPIAFAPHGGERAVWAAAILATITDHGTAAALAQWDAAAMPSDDAP